MNFENDYNLIPPNELERRVRLNNFTNQELSDLVDFLYTLPRYIRNEYVRKLREIVILNGFEGDVILRWDPPALATMFMARGDRWDYIIEQITKTTYPERTTTDTAEGLRLQPDELNELTDTPTPDTSPERVNLPEFAKIIDTPEMRKAQETGLIDEQYKWLKGLQLLACFAREMSLKYKLNNGQNADGTPRVNWQIFERLFDIQKGKLRNNYNDIQKTGQPPRDINLIDTLFN